MSRNRPQLERASLAQAVTTALRRTRYPLPTADVIASVAGILGLGDQSLGLAVVQVSYVELAKRLKKHGFKDETEDSITAKLKRGTFTASFLLASLAALESEGVRLEDV